MVKVSGLFLRFSTQAEFVFCGLSLVDCIMKAEIFISAMICVVVDKKKHHMDTLTRSQIGLFFYQRWSVRSFSTGGLRHLAGKGCKNPVNDRLTTRDTRLVRQRSPEPHQNGLEDEITALNVNHCFVSIYQLHFHVGVRFHKTDCEMLLAGSGPKARWRSDPPVTVEGEVDVQSDAVVNRQAHQLITQQVKEEGTADRANTIHTIPAATSTQPRGTDPRDGTRA